jgi:hypothetical protein
VVGGPGVFSAVGGRRDAYVRVKLVVNEPTLRRPTEKQMSATERSVVLSRVMAR